MRAPSDPNEQIKFSTSAYVRTYIDLLAKKGLYGTTRSSVIDHIVRQAIIAMSQSANPPLSNADLDESLGVTPAVPTPSATPREAHAA